MLCWWKLLFSLNETPRCPGKAYIDTVIQLHYSLPRLVTCGVRNHHLRHFSVFRVSYLLTSHTRKPWNQKSETTLKFMNVWNPMGNGLVGRKLKKKSFLISKLAQWIKILGIWWPEFSPYDIYGGWSGPNSTSFPLISTHVLWHVWALPPLHIPSKQTNKQIQLNIIHTEVQLIW